MVRSKKALIGITLIIAIVLSSFATLALLQLGKASPNPIVIPDPPVIEIPYCATADIAICVEDFTDLFAFEFKIWWLKGVVEYTGYEWKPYPPPWVPALTVGPQFDENETHKAVQFGITAMPPASPFSYSGRWPFIDIFWHCIQPGADTPLIFDRDFTHLINQAGQPIPIEEIIDGLIINEMYWKENYTDYAPSGVPDFDQRQDNWGKIDPASGMWKWTWCGPTAVGNSLWWMDSRFEPGATPPPEISDGFPLVQNYTAGKDDHDPQNVQPFITDLGWYMDTDGNRTGYPWSGTNVHQMEKGIAMYLRDRGLETTFVIKKMKMPDFYYIEEEIEKCEDVILLLGIWQSLDGDTWWRVGGHYVTCAGVDSSNATLAFCDPCANNAEAGGFGRVLPPGVPHVHPPPPVAPPQQDTVHNNASFVSHDLYSVSLTSPSPGGIFAVDFYEPLTDPDFMQNIEGQNCPSEFTSQEGPWNPAAPFIAAEVEYSVIISPADWYFKAEQEDYAPSGVPDFDEKQWSLYANWTNPYPPVGTWSWCGPVAVANSLWWLDSEFEPNPIPPPTINDGFPLVQSYGAWDDHDPQNFPYLIEHLATYMNVDGRFEPPEHCGTEVHDMERGIDAYLQDKGLDWKFYEHTEKAPDFYWIEDEIKRCEDVILLLGFWQNIGTEMEPYWIRNGGHYVTCAGVDSENMMLAISDPFIDNAEWGFPGRVIPPPPHNHTGPPETLHNNATYVSHDFYLVGPSPSPGGPWGLYQYPAEDIIDNFDSCQNTPEEFWEYDDRYIEGLPIYTEIEYAVVVSCETGVVAAGSEDGYVYVHDFFGNLLWKWGTEAYAVSVALDNDAKYLAAGWRYGESGLLGFFDVNAVTGGGINPPLWTKSLLISESYDGGWGGKESKSVDVKYNFYNECYIVAAAHDYGLNLYDQWGNLIWQYFDEEGPETIVRISQDGNYIVCADYHSMILHYFSHLSDGVPGWGPNDGMPVWSFGGDPHEFAVYWTAISGLGDYVAVSGWDEPYPPSNPQNTAGVILLNKTGGEVWAYSLPKGGYVRVDMPCHGRSVVSVNDDPSDAFGCDLNYFSDGGDGWDSGDGTPIWTWWPGAPAPQVNTHDLYTVAISENGDYVATGGAPPNTYLLTNTSVLKQTMAATPGNATQSADLTFTGKYGAYGDNHGVIWFFEKDTGVVWSQNTNAPIRSIAVSKLYPCMFPFPYHDLNVTDVTPDSVSVAVGSVVNVNVTVTNEGDFAESFFDVFLEVLSNGMPQPSVSPSPAMVASLASGASTTIAFTWDTTGLPQGDYTLIAKASIVQDETDVYDNTFVNGVVKVTVVVPPPPPAEDLELYPREVVDLEDPTGTQWHELHPNKTHYYDLTSWEPGNVLSPEDQIDMYLIDPPEKIYVFTDFVDPSFPICTEWFEEFPTPQWWHLSSWEDNGDGYLSECDQIDMTNMDTGEVVWFHVQFIDPPTPEPGPRMMHLDVKYFFQVDEVTVDMSLSPVEGGSQIFAEYKCGYWTFDPKNPICTKWNQIEPQVGPVRCLHLTSWEDLDLDGELSPGDVIDVTPLYPNPGPVEWYYVDFMSISLMLNPKPSPPVVPPPPVGPVYLESLISYDEFDLANPVCTYWHEIHPIYSRIWHLSSWEDRLGFSPSDQIVLALKDEFGEPIPGTEVEYHVDKLTVAMNMTSMYDGIEHIVKFEGSLKQFKVYYWAIPISTQWHEVNPTYCRQWHLLDWLDDNPDGRLGFCDYILMIDKHTGDIEEFHVESLSTDMYVTQAHDVAVTNVTTSKDGCIPMPTVSNSSFVKINVTVFNEGTYTETFTVNAYANMAMVANTIVTNLAPGTQVTVTLTWDTTGFALGNYTVSAYAVPVSGEVDTTDNTFTDGWILVVRPGDINGDTAVNYLDAILLGAAFDCGIGHERWNPNADLNGDEYINYLDSIILGGNFDF